MDKFVETVGRGAGTCADYGKGPGLVMGYYDGNTVTAMWNYASSAVTSNGSVIGDPQPAGDKCDSRDTTSMSSSNENVGDLLNAQGITWGWFQGGFDDCAASHTSEGGQTSKDYIPHHEPFQYYASTANPQHLPPTSTDAIGHTDQANHQYDLSRFWDALGAGDLPAVSFLKAPAYEDGHAGYSNPLDEQRFAVDTINRLERSDQWGSTAVIIAYDDSDGWYDHQMSPIVNESGDSAHDGAVQGGACGSASNAMGGYLDRCGYGPRLPLLLISPWARENYVSSVLTDQTSITRFIEDNWLGSQRISAISLDNHAAPLLDMFDFSQSHMRRLILDPDTGAVVSAP